MGLVLTRGLMNSTVEIAQQDAIPVNHALMVGAVLFVLQVKHCVQEGVLILKQMKQIAADAQQLAGLTRFA